MTKRSYNFVAVMALMGGTALALAGAGVALRTAEGALAMGLAPKIATLADVLLRADLRRAYGGVPRIAVGAV